ncbi:MAG: hydrogen gas-evolving membrane-bound hydrogenase subunit E, partial [Eubacteriales bacterium]
MSKRKTDRAYEQTSSYKFFNWLQGEHDPYLDRVELHPQIEHKLSPEVVAEHMEERKKLYEEVYSLTRNKELKWIKILYTITCIIVCITLLFMLIIVASHMPPTGVSTNPNNNEVSKRYIEQSLSETGSVNQVTAMISSYRAFDTFGETHVLFIATICVMILLLIKEEENQDPDEILVQQYDEILQINAYILIPLVFMFGIYIILNGHISPGGGFAGGSILGAGLILHTCAYGFGRTRRFFDTH